MPDNEVRGLLHNVIGASNALIVYLNQHPDVFSEHVRKMLVEIDYQLNSTADEVADFVGAFPAPEVESQCLTVYPPDAYQTQWTVSGDLREVIDLDEHTGRYNDSTNYVVQDMLRAEVWTVEFDSEYSCFFAYTGTEAQAMTLRDAAMDIAKRLKEGI